MSVGERDPLTGHQTTGHEWNGITELNTRVPRAVWFFIILTHVWALIIWILLPSFPMLTTHTKGLLGLDQRQEVREDIAAAEAARAGWKKQVSELPVEEITSKPDLMVQVNDTAHQLFSDNCAGCHGQNAGGGPGFPSLTDRAWLWGKDIPTTLETLRVGINTNHPDTRIAQMLAFGKDGILSREEVRSVVSYVQSISGSDVAPEKVTAGKQVFADNCVSCHGDDGAGLTEVGAPNLTDNFWIYGGSSEDLFRTIWNGRQGWMPAWEGRLSDTDRKILAIYLQQLGEEQTQ